MTLLERLADRLEAETQARHRHYHVYSWNVCREGYCAADRALIAAARQDIPALLAVADEARAVVDAYHGSDGDDCGGCFMDELRDALAALRGLADDAIRSEAPAPLDVEALQEVAAAAWAVVRNMDATGGFIDADREARLRAALAALPAPAATGDTGEREATP